MTEESFKALVRFSMVLFALAVGGIFLGRYLQKHISLPRMFSKSQRTIPVVEKSPLQKKPVPNQTNQDLKGTDPFGYPRETADKLQIIALLKNRQYKELNVLLEGYQTQFEKDFRNENKVIDGFDSFDILDASIEPLLNEWVDAYRQSFSPYLSRAEFFMAKAWENRGTKWAKDTTDEQFKAMGRYFALAKEDTQKAMLLHAKLLPAYVTLINMARANGDEDDADRLAAEVLKQMPESFHARYTYMLSLLPRWGGSYEAMEAFATESEKLLSINPKFRIFRGFIDWDKGRYLRSEKRNEDALQAYNAALQYGEYWRFLEDRGNVLRLLKRFPEALADFDRALEMRPQMISLLVGRGETLCNMNRVKEGIQDYELAARFDSGDKLLKESRRRASQVQLIAGHELHKKKELQNALPHYDVTITIDKSNPEVYYWRGRAYLDMNRLDLARPDFQEAIRLNPHHFESYRALDWVLFKGGELNTIISYWNQYLDLEPGDAGAYLERAGTYYHKKDFQASSKDAKKACDLGNQKGCLLYERVQKR